MTTDKTQNAGVATDSAPTSGSVDYELNRRTAIFGVLVGHCGRTLTPDEIDQLLEEIVFEMEEGGMSWAFQPNAPDETRGTET